MSTTALLLALATAGLGCALVVCWRLYRANQTLRHESVIDPLTGVLHYGKLQEILHTELERASRFDRPLAVLMVDLDLFREVNSQYGHQRGSAILREFAQRVHSSIRAVDTPARFGGDEFVVVLPETGEHGVPQVADRICRIVRENPFAGDGTELPVQLSVSIGAALYGRHGVTVSQLLRSADDALYLAKRAGRDGWAMARSVMPLLPSPIELFAIEPPTEPVEGAEPPTPVER
ncbi:MAG TPA: GGDEF domain-containing protein [Actinomycetes bacterium]|nr:GGDEF domain-containing protein [Actinomycetes bacterium]